MNTLKKTLAVLGSLSVALYSAQLFASTAANTTITNTVTVYYDDAADQAQTPEEASVDITVDLVASAPTLTSPADIDPSTENTGESLVYTITSTANGPDTYNFSSTDSRSNMDADATFSTPSVDLGGTTLALDAALTDTFIVVPYDGDDSDDIVNGIEAGDLIVINGVEYTVGAIDEATTLGLSAPNTVRIPITDVGGITAADTIGSIVGERQDVTVTATTDSISGGTSGTHSVTTRATSADDVAVFTDAAAVTITVRRPLLTVTKYARNLDNPVIGGGAYGGLGLPALDDFYATDVSGQPGDEIQYLIVIDNSDPSATEDAEDVVVEDPIPQFTTFVPGSILLDADGTAVNVAGFAAQDETVDQPALDNDAAELDTTGNGTVYVYAGVGGSDTSVGFDNNDDGGTVAAGDISRVIFSVTIDN